MSDLTPITREEALLDGADLEPITRKEQFIKRIYDKTQEIPDPITREEWFLKKAGEGTSPVTIEQLNATENGTYSEPGKAYSPVIVEVPEPTLITKSITANGTYSASDDNADGYSSVTVAVDGFRKKSIANTPTDIASFNDGTANPMPSLEISIEPVQDLHGYDYPWSAGGGKNLAELQQGTVNIWTGEEEPSTTRVHTNYIPIQTAQNYIASSENNGWSVRNGVSYDENKNLIGNNIYPDPQSNIFQVSDSRVRYVRFIYSHIDGSETCTPSDYWYQFENGSTATSYEPYSNICPISGHTEADVTVTDDLTTPTETHTTSIPFHDNSDNPITVYGGTLNVTSGELRVTMANIDLGSLSWTKSSTSIFRADVSDKKAGVSPLLCENYAYYANSGFAVPDKKISDTNSENYETTIFINDSSHESDTAATFKTAMNGVQLVYPLATPQTYQLTPTQVTTLLGQNNIFADCGQILEGEYFVTL